MFLPSLAISSSKGICNLITEYACGQRPVTKKLKIENGKQEDSATGMQVFVAEAATKFFSFTHSIQKIPYQNNIIPGRLWLGQLAAARNYSWIKKVGISRICSVTQWGNATKFHEAKGVVYHTIHIEDKPECRILDHLDDAVRLLNIEQ